MNIRGLAVAGIVLAALVGVLYWSNHHMPSETPAVSADTPPKILTLTDSDIQKIGIEKKGAEELALARNSSGKWEMTAPKPMAADQDAVSGVVSTLSSLSSDRLVEAKASDLQTYGLAQPAVEVEISEKNNKNQKLLLGDDTPTGGGVYAALAGDPRVFTIPTYEKNSLDKTVNDLRDKRLLTLDSDKVSRVELVAKNQDIEFGRNKDDWQILKPKPLRADNSAVGDLVRELTGARMDVSSSSDDAKKTAAAFASGAPVATAKLTGPSGTQELQVRKEKGDYYAKSSVVEGVYKVPSTVGQAVDKKLDDFRNKKLFDFGFTDPSKIEVQDGTKTYFLTKGGEDWWAADSKKLDPESAQTLVDDVRDLAASKFVDSGFTTAIVSLTATSSDGKRIEKVLISKSGDNYIAKRENEPALYQLDAKSVTDLQKAAQDLKPAPAAAKAGK